jgi:hypothetical protein
MQKNIESDTTAVLEVVRQLAALMIARDTAAVNKILDKNYTLTNTTGYVQPKAEWFNEIAKESMKYYAARELSHPINLNGNTAEVIIQNLVDATIGGNRNIRRLQQKLKLEKRNKNWIVLSSVASRF